MLIKEDFVSNLLENFSAWLEDQKIRRFHRNGLSEKKIKSLELDLEVTLPKEYREIVETLGVFLHYSRVELYHEKKLYQANIHPKKRRPEQILEFACHAGGGVFCFDFKELIHKMPVVLLYSYPDYQVLWKPNCSFKSWYQLLQIYTFVEEKNYFEQDTLEQWTEAAIKEIRTIYHRLKIHPYNEQKEFMLL